MIKGIEIDFKEDDNQYFENEWNNDIDCNLLLIALLETINDICIEYNLETNEQLKKYIQLGSVDNYINDKEKTKMEKYKTF